MISPAHPFAPGHGMVSVWFSYSWINAHPLYNQIQPVGQSPTAQNSNLTLLI